MVLIKCIDEIHPKIGSLTSMFIVVVFLIIIIIIIVTVIDFFFRIAGSVKETQNYYPCRTQGDVMRDKVFSRKCSM